MPNAVFSIVLLLIGIPLTLGIIGGIFWNIGTQFWERGFKGQRGVVRMNTNFWSGFVNSQEQGENIWESVFNGAMNVPKPGCLARLFLYPAVFCFWLVSIYFKLLFLPVRLAWYVVTWPFRLILRIISSPFRQDRVSQ